MNPSMSLKIAHFYPDLLNLYGDRGNLITLMKRCEWRGITCTVQAVSLGQAFDASQYDLAFLGGGQDYEQNLLQDDFLSQKGQSIIDAVEDGFVFLCVCGGYQLMGRYYQETNGERIECLGALDIYTEAEEKRLIGDSVSESRHLSSAGYDPLLVGFENHAGRTYLGKQVQPLALVRKGGGNNGQDQTEGAIHNNTYCTYYHGSFLPKNPGMADLLIEKALKRRYKQFEQLMQLDCQMENNARNYLLSCK